MKHKVLFCGTPAFAVPSLSALVNDPDIEVVHVLSQPDRPAGRGHKMQSSPVKVFAEQKQLSISTPENINDPEITEFLKTLHLDACVVVAYGQILKKPFLEIFNNKCVNIHGSLLPRWRGAAPIQRALMAGDKESGVSLQVVVLKLDAGAVIAERKLPLALDTNALQLHDSLSVLGADLLQKEFKQFLRGELTPQTQDEGLVTHAAKIDKKECWIDWSQPASAIHNKIRGLAMGPQAYSTHAGRHYKFYQTHVLDGTAVPGQVARVEKASFNIGCGSGMLQILDIQPESKKRMPVEEFLKGANLVQGEFFGK